MTSQVVLYGGKLSLYSARVRSFLRHQRIPFTERGPGSARALNHIYPTIGRRIVPVVELADGHLIQDGALIMDHFEASGQGRFSIYPDDPALHVVARLFDLFGNEGLMRPAMHYRWERTEHAEFIGHIFRETLPMHKDAEGQKKAFEKLSGFLRMWTQAIGATPKNAAAIEASYTDFLDRLNRHLALMPFVLGGQPTIADYALFGPMFAHLGRDPVPLALMQSRAPFVFDWTERMNAFEDIEDAVSVSWGKELVDLREPPETLLSLLAYIAEEYAGEFAAHHAFCAQWLEDQPSEEAILAWRPIGMTKFDLRGVSMPVPVKAYRHFLSQRLTAVFDSAPAADQETVRTLFEGHGLSCFLDLRLARQVGQRDHLEVWEPANLSAG